MKLSSGEYPTKTMTATRRLLAIVVILILCVIIAIAVGLVIGLKATQPSSNVKPVYLYQNAAVATDAGPCSDIASDFLKKGGSAVDVSIVALLCSGLYNTHSTGVGGGHFMMYYHHETKSIDMIDARESAPLAATRDMYNDSSVSSVKGGTAIAVPGEIAGFWKAHQLYGILEWKSLFEPIIDLARKGFATTASLAAATAVRVDDIRGNPVLSEIFLRDDGGPIQQGDIIYRKRFAETLEIIANEGGNAFYNGTLAQNIVKDIQENGGIITEQDMAQYEVRQRKPLATKLDNGLLVYTPPPPSSGAVVALILNIIAGYGLTKSNFDNTDARTKSLHKMIEAFKFSYAQRAYLGDEDFVDVSELVSNMTSRQFADALRSKISENITHDPQYYGLLHSVPDDQGTSHMCVLDQYGNAVSATGTVNLFYGSKVMGNRTGIIFNNEMDDFSKPGTANYFGFPPSETNFIEPKKRPMSSMAPVIIVDNEGAVQVILGASGGSRIPSGVAEVLIKHLWGEYSITESVRDKRLHHQWIPDVIRYEPGFDWNILYGLKAMGHELAEKVYLSTVQAISCLQGESIEAFSDERKGGYPAGF